MSWPALVVAASLLASACATSTGAVRPIGLNQETELAPGQSVQSGALRVTFTQVDGDSRCPADVTCVWEGDARVKIDVSEQPLPDDVELIFEASGSPRALGAVLHSAARGGTVVQVGNLPGAPAPAALGDLVTREITWIGSYRFVDEITDAIAAMAAGLDVTPLMTHSFDIDDAETAMQVAADPSSGSSKVMLRLS